MLPPGYHLNQIIKQAVTDSHDAVEVLPPSFLSGPDWGLFADREDRSILVRILNPVRDPADLTFTLRDAERAAKVHPSLVMTYIFIPESEEIMLEKWIQTAEAPKGMAQNASIRFFSYGVQDREGSLRLAIHEKAMIAPQGASLMGQGPSEDEMIQSASDELIPELTPTERRDIEAISRELRRILEGDLST